MVCPCDLVASLELLMIVTVRTMSQRATAAPCCETRSTSSSPAPSLSERTRSFRLGPTQAKVTAYKLDAYVQPLEVFCPVDWRDVCKLITLQPQLVGPRSLAVHLYGEMWRLGRLDKDAVYHPASIYEQLKRRYGVAAPT